MPELPEVETIARGLSPELTGRVIASVDVRWPGALVRPAGGQSRMHAGDAAPFVARVAGRRILGARRRAKLLILDLSDAEGGGLHLVFHLKMSGCLWIPPGARCGQPNAQADAHTRIIFALDDGRELHFRDPRRFGYCLALTGPELAAEPFIAALGPEPLEISAREFAARLRARGRNIKALLLDQAVLAGVGNIYADESLFRAGIRPQRAGADISAERLEGLHAALQAVLRQAIAENGSSFRDFVDHKGDSGAFQNLFQVYGRAGLPCVLCGRPLVSAVVAGRSTVWCPACQH